MFPINAAKVITAMAVVKNTETPPGHEGLPSILM